MQTLGTRLIQKGRPRAPLHGPSQRVRAQALGDLEALRKHGRRIIRIHLGRDVRQGLRDLDQAITVTLRGEARRSVLLTGADNATV